MNKLDEFLKAYLTCALWSSIDENDTPLDENYDIADFSKEALDRATKDCTLFLKLNSNLIESLKGYNQDIYSQSGHDFWLTRNRHGAGFWDRGYPEKIGEILTRYCQTFTELHLFVNDNGKVEME